jgi:hypothetical protein
MSLLYASTFADALGKLNHQEQKQVKITTVDLMMNLKGAGLSLERINRAADTGMWSARVSRDLRIILKRDDEDIVLAYVGHHNDAYAWAERRKIARHERTGAMQIVEVIERKVEGASFDWTAGVATAQPTPTDQMQPFWSLSDDDMLDVGVPRDWLQPVREMVEDELDRLFDHLPAEAAEALYDYATGGRLENHIRKPVDEVRAIGSISFSMDRLSTEAGLGFIVPDSVRRMETADTSGFSHPDAQRRFRVVESVEELMAALDAPFEKWAVFLHPAQRALVEKSASGPTRVTGSAGTGKTIVALHRAVHLAQHYQTARVLLTTFSEPLAEALERKLAILTEATTDLRDRIAVRTLDDAAIAIYTDHIGAPTIADDDTIGQLVEEAIALGHGTGLTRVFLLEEWAELVDAWCVESSESYSDIPRTGRRTRLGPKQRDAAWEVFAHVRNALKARNLVTQAEIYGHLRNLIRDHAVLGLSHIVVDEAQDLTVAQVRFLGEVAKQRRDAVFLAGDIGQRIFRLPFSWAKLGLDIRGRSHSLKVNYRTSHQIRSMADKLLPPSITDLDGIEEGRGGTVSVFDGLDPEVVYAEDELEECALVGRWIEECMAAGIAPAELGVLVRSEQQRARAEQAVAASVAKLDGEDVRIATMHDAKGLEFRAVAVMACDEDVIPDQTRMAGIGDIAELETVYETERHLLYVACTRARDRLLVSCVQPGSEFLDDLETRVSSWK